MNELVEKIRWCYRMMHFTKWLCDRAADDHMKRLLARFAFLHIDTLSKLLPQVKNLLKPMGNVAAAGVLTKRFADDYEKTYAPIRDRLAAHRQGLPVNELYEIWFTDIEAAVIDVFLSDVAETYQAFQALNGALPPLDTSPEEADQDLKQKLETALAKKQEVIQVGSSSFDLMAPSTVVLITGSEYQRVGSRLLSIEGFRAFVAQRLLPLAKPGGDSERLFKMAYLTETVSLIDNMYPHAVANPAHQQKSYLELAREQKPHKALAQLNHAHTHHDSALETEVRNVRNKIAAHVDTVLPLNDLLATLDALGFEKIRSLGDPAYAAFSKSRAADPRTMPLLASGPIPNALQIEEKPTKPFES